MATTPKKLYIGSPSTSSTTIYTVPANTTTIVKEIILANPSSTTSTVTVILGGKNFIYNYSVSANDLVTIDITQVLNATDTISALQSVSNNINLFISGVEVA